MKSRIVQIGNSRGIRLPKALLEEAQLADEVELEAKPGRMSFVKETGLGLAGPLLLDTCASEAKTGCLIQRQPHVLTRKNGGGVRSQSAHPG